MKKLLAYVLVLAMAAGMLVGCGETENTELKDAASYVFNMYKDAAPATYSVDYEVVSKVKVGTNVYNITWSTDATEENVKVVPGESMTTIDVNTENPDEVSYKLTATLVDDKGNTESVSFDRLTPAAIILDAGMSYAEIVDAAYQIAEGGALEDTFRLYGTITKIDTAWSDDYQNITVTIAVEGKEDKPIMCYRLVGDGAKDLAVGDKITVEGILKNYKGTIEFDAGCNLDSVIKGKGDEASTSTDAPATMPTDVAAIIDAAYALEDGASLPEACTLTGKIKTIDTEWSEQYGNITVTIEVAGSEDQPIMCFRLKGDGANALKVGDTITVTGTLINYKGTIEFDAGCTLK